MGSPPLPFNGCAAVLAATIVGASLGALLLSVSPGMVGDGGVEASIGLAPLIALFSLPIWLIGVAVVGMPIRFLLASMGLNGPLTAVLLGASLVGLAWAATNSWGASGPSSDWTDSAWNTSVGVVSGGLAGWAAWFAGRAERRSAS